VDSNGIELIFFRGCPHLDKARANLAEACSEEGLPPAWAEWDLDDPQTPEERQRFPSPTVLVDGIDVEPTSGVSGRSCRASGPATVEALRRAIRVNNKPNRGSV
jgi:hypothetical protein